MGEFDLTIKQDVVELMELSKTRSEWNDNCDRVKAANEGAYPPFWWNAIVLSGVVERTANTWGGDAKIHVEVMA